MADNYYDPNEEAYNKMLGVNRSSTAIPPAPSTPPTIAPQEQKTSLYYDPNEEAYNKMLGTTQASAMSPSLAQTRNTAEQYGKAAGIGTVKGAASILDMTISPILQDIDASLPTFSEKAEKYLPKVEGGVGPKITEKAFEGGTSGLITGPGGIFPSAVSSVASELAGGNVWAGLAAGTVAGMRGIPKLGYKGELKPNTEWGAANERLGLPGASITEANPTNAKQRFQAVLQGLPWAGNTFAKRAGARNEAFKHIVDDELLKLGAAENPTQAGAALRTGAESRVAQIKQELANENDEIDRMFVTNSVPLDYITNAFTNIEGKIDHFQQAARSLGTPAFRQFIKDFDENAVFNMNNGINLGWTGQPMITVNDIRQLRSGIGQHVEDAIFGGPRAMRVEEAKTLYKAFSDSLRDAIPSPMWARFDENMARQAVYYDTLEKVVAPLVKEVNPEVLWKSSQNQAKLGATKLADIRQQIDAVDPALWDTYAGYTLRQMGKTNQNEFSMNTYATNWNKMPDEVKQILFGDTQYGELPQLYQDLAIAANRFKTANSKYNFSESGNVLNTASWVQKLSLAAETLLIGAFVPHQLNFYGHMPMGTGQALTVLGLTAAGHLGVEKMLAHMMTSPTLLRWAATDWSGRGQAAAISALRALPGVDENVKNAISTYGDSLTGGKRTGDTTDFNLMPGEKSRQALGPEPPVGASMGFAEGGQVHPKYEGEEPFDFDKAVRESNKSVLDWVIQNEPSYAEGEQMPPNALESKMRNDAMIEESDADFERQLFGGREQPLVKAIKNPPKHVGLAEGGPVEKTTSVLSQVLGIDPSIMRGAAKYMYINESKLDPNIVNPTSGAYGIAQWLGSRKRELFGKYGNKPSMDQQLEHIGHELTRGGEGATLKALKNAKSEKEAYDIWGSMFERPGEAALKKAGVNYNPGTVEGKNVMTASNSSTSSKPISVLDMVIRQPEEPEPEVVDKHEGIRTALLEGADPGTQAAIKSILGTGEKGARV